MFTEILSLFPEQEGNHKVDITPNDFSASEPIQSLLQEQAAVPQGDMSAEKITPATDSHATSTGNDLDYLC